MSDPASSRLSRRGRWIGVGIGAAIVALFTAANAHLIYIALASQPDCVPHLSAPDASGAAYRAAKSAC